MRDPGHREIPHPPVPPAGGATETGLALGAAGHLEETHDGGGAVGFQAGG